MDDMIEEKFTNKSNSYTSDKQDEQDFDCERRLLQLEREKRNITKSKIHNNAINVVKNKSDCHKDQLQDTCKDVRIKDQASNSAQINEITTTLGQNIKNDGTLQFLAIIYSEIIKGINDIKYIYLTINKKKL